MHSNKKTEDQCYEHFLWDIPDQSIPDGKLLFIAQSICNKYKQTKETTCSAIFYPYSDLKNTIRFDQHLIKIRISDILRTAPETIIAYLIEILLAKATHRKPQQHWLDQFNEYIHSPDIAERHTLIRCSRKRKILTSPQGKHYNLLEIFGRVNQKYFDGKLPQPKLSWSPKRSRRKLGYYEESLDLIVISQNLDQKRVPEFIVDYIMYHELLHTVIRPTRRNGRRIVHSKEFNQQERKFEHYNDVLRWLKESF